MRVGERVRVRVRVRVTVRGACVRSEGECRLCPSQTLDGTSCACNVCVCVMVGVCVKSVIIQIHVGHVADRQTDRQTDRQAADTHHSDSRLVIS